MFVKIFLHFRFWKLKESSIRFVGKNSRFAKSPRRHKYVEYAKIGSITNKLMSINTHLKFINPQSFLAQLQVINSVQISELWVL